MLRTHKIISAFVSFIIGTGISWAQNPSETAVITFTGEQSFDGFGYSLSSGYDVNTDGLSDILVGAFSSSGLSGAGHVYLFHGGNFSGSTMNATDAPVLIVGEHLGDQFGFSVSLEGDFNSDGLHDIVVGARNNSTVGYNAGRVYLFYSKRNMTTPVEGINADVIITGDNEDDQFGHSVAIGDVDGDRKNDLVVGTGASEKVYVFFNATLKDTFKASQADVIIEGENLGDSFGSALEVEDINKDGKADILVGASHNDEVADNSGKVYVFLGALTAKKNVSAKEANVIITGNSRGARFGISISSAGDFNKDGVPDFIVGSTGNGQGSAYLFWGQKGDMTQTSINESAVIFTGIGKNNTFATAVRDAGDFNKDGFSDIAIGDSWSVTEEGTGLGRVYVFMGNNQKGHRKAEDADVKLIGEEKEDSFGSVLSFAGDMNGDEADDIIVGAYRNSMNGPFSGKIYLVFKTSKK